MKSPIGRKLCLMSAAIVLSGSGYAITASAQDAKVDQYVSVLSRIADTKLAISQKEAFVSNQKNQIASLRAQIKSVDATKKTVGPMLSKMAAAIESEIKTDLPFKQGERYARLDDFNDVLSDAEASMGEKMRKALNIYDIELGYGNSVGAYAGNHPSEPGTRYKACEADELSAGCALTSDLKKKMGYNRDGVKEGGGATLFDLKDSLKDGSYLHYGRLAYIYVQHDSSEAWRYDKDAKGWVQLSGADVLNARRSVRIARGESAPGVITAPIAIQE